MTVWDGELDAWIHGLIKVTAQLVGTPECPLPHKKAKHARYCTVRSCDRDECFVEPLEAR